MSTLGEPGKAKAAQRHIRAAHYMAQPNGAQLTEIARLIDRHKVDPKVAQVFALGQAAEAEQILETGRVRGKIVLEMEG